MPYATGCRDCGGTTDGSTRCASCRKARNKAAAELRDYRRAEGLCLTCGVPVAKTKMVPDGWNTTSSAHKRVRQPAAYCAVHLAYYAARQRPGSGRG